jgi:hypothetical protein
LVSWTLAAESPSPPRFTDGRLPKLTHLNIAFAPRKLAISPTFSNSASSYTSYSSPPKTLRLHTMTPRTYRDRKGLQIQPRIS